MAILSFTNRVIIQDPETIKKIKSELEKPLNYTKEELTLNIELSPLALKLRTLRLQKNLSFETVSQTTGIAIEDLMAFETDKASPTEEEKQILFDFLK